MIAAAIDPFDGDNLRPPPAGTPAGACAEGSTKHGARVVVAKYRAWLALPTSGGVWESLITEWDRQHQVNSAAIIEYLRDLGFRVLPRASDDGRIREAGVWILPRDPIAPTSPLGQMLGSGALARRGLNAIVCEVNRLNAAFTTWLVPNLASAKNPPEFIVNADHMSDATRRDLVHALTAHGWYCFPHHGGYIAHRDVHKIE